MDENYLFHQTPKDLAKDLMPFVPINADDVLYEPFKGEGAFFDAFPTENTKLWTEIAYGKDYKDFSKDLTSQIFLEVRSAKKYGAKFVTTKDNLFSSSKLINASLLNLSSNHKKILCANRFKNLSSKLS